MILGFEGFSKDINNKLEKIQDAIVYEMKHNIEYKECRIYIESNIRKGAAKFTIKTKTSSLVTECLVKIKDLLDIDEKKFAKKLLYERHYYG